MTASPRPALPGVEDVPRVATQITGGCLVAHVQIELYSDTLARFRHDFLHQLATSGVRRAIIDVSAVDIMDSFAYHAICAIAKTAQVMGARTLLAGIQPGVASALAEVGVDVTLVETVLSLDMGISRLAAPKKVTAETRVSSAAARGRNPT